MAAMLKKKKRADLEEQKAKAEFNRESKIRETKKKINNMKLNEDYRYLPLFDDKTGDMYTSLKYKWKIIVERTQHREEKVKDPKEKIREIKEKLKTSPLYSFNHSDELETGKE